MPWTTRSRFVGENMNNQKNQQDWPEAEHRELDALLSELGHLSPGKGFSDAVMARVEIPGLAVATQPNFAISKKLAWALFGGYSVASAASLAALIGFFLNRTFQFGTVATSTLAFSAAVWQSLHGILETGFSAAINALPLLLGAAGALTISSLVSAVGLYWIMNSYSTGRTPLHAIR